MHELNKLKNALKFPTSIIVRGQDLLGIELAKSLLEQGGFVILIDRGSQEVGKYIHLISHYENLLILDYSGLVTLNQELRRLDYVFYLNHQFADFSQKISTQEFLQASNYLDAVLDLTAKFDAKFLLSTSIKAHQQLVADKLSDLNYNMNSQERYTVYSDLEIQRYAESLVKEYQDKVGINARVVRTGTLLGKGMEINLDSSLIKLIIQGLQGKNLIMPGDGLETDYYIHYLDAAYGLIKAQFSPNTKGNIYTLANEEEVSILSIAYKLLEVLPNAKEIKFNSEDHSLPPIKLYKPAKNLTTVGWKPRIALERALAQTIDYLKSKLEDAHGSVAALDKELIPIPGSKVAESKTFKQKLLDFFFIAEAEPAAMNIEDSSAVVNTEGALARLIAERKAQEKARRGNIILANNQLRSTMQVKPKKNALQRLDDNLAKSLWALRRRFDFFRNMTVLDFVLFLFAMVGLALIYFLAIAPVFSLGRNFYFAYADLDSLSKTAVYNDYAKNKELTQDLSNNLKSAQQRISDLEFAFIISQQEDSYKKTQIFLANAIQYCANLDNIYTALQPWNTYAAGFNPNFIYRFDNDKFISVDSKTQYAELVTKIFDNRSNLSLSLNAADKIYPDLLAGLDQYPETITKYFRPSLVAMGGDLQDLKVLKSGFEYAPTLLGRDATRNYLVILQDNLRYTSGGGDFAGYFVFQVRNGAIVSIKAQSIAKFANTNPNFNAQTLEEIKLVSNSIIDNSNARLRDAALIPDRDLMLATLQDFIEKQEAMKFDMVITANDNTLKDILGSDGVEFKQQNINANNFATTINSLIQGNETEAARDDVLLGITAKLLEAKGNDLMKSGLVTVLGQSYLNGDIGLYSTNSNIKKFLTAVTPVRLQATNKVIIGVNYDQKNVVPAKLPALTVSGTVVIKKDGSSRQDLTLSVSNIETMQNAVFCTNYGTRDLTTPNVAKELVSQVLSFTLDRSCSIFLKTADLKYQVVYNGPTAASKVDANHPYQLELISAPGLKIDYDIEFQFESGLGELTPVDASSTKQANGYLYRGTLSGSKLFTFNAK